MLIGTGGNQKNKINDPGVAPCHCIIVPDEDGIFIVEPTNFRPTFIEDERISGDSVVTPDTNIRLGDFFSGKIKDLIQPFDIASLKDWGLATQRFDSLTDLDVFQLTVDLCYPDEDLNIINLSSLKLCRAYYLIEEEKFREAQILIYESGDELYAAQDGSDELKSSYLSSMVLLYYFYQKIQMDDLGQTTLDRCKIMIDMGIACSSTVLDFLKL